MKKYIAVWMFMFAMAAVFIEFGPTVEDPLAPIASAAREQVEEWSFTRRTSSPTEKRNPAIAIDPTRRIQHFAWSEQDESGYFQIWTATAGADGFGFRSIQRTQNRYNSGSPQVTVDTPEGLVHLVYTEEDDRGRSQIWTARMNLDSDSWSAVGLTILPGHCRNPHLCLDSATGGLFIVFEEVDETGSAFIKLARTAADGAGWVILSKTDDDIQTDYSIPGRNPQLALHQRAGTIHVAFEQDDSGGISQIWTASLLIDGTGWSSRKMTDSPYQCRNPSLVLDTVNNRIYLVYERDDEKGLSQIWSARMNTDGTGWHTVKRTSELDVWYGMPLARSALDRHSPALAYNRESEEIHCTYLENLNGWQIVSAKTGTETVTFNTALIPAKRPHLILDTPKPWFDTENDRICYVYRGYTPYYGQQIWTAETDSRGLGWKARRKTFLKQGALGVAVCRDPKTGVMHYTFSESNNLPVYTAQTNRDGSGWFITNKIDCPFFGSGSSSVYDPVHDKIHYVFVGDESGKARLWLAEMNSDGTGWKTVPLATLECSPDLAKPAFVLHSATKTIHLIYVDGSYDDRTIAVWTARVGTDGTGWQAHRRLQTFVESPSPGILLDHARGTLHYMFSAARFDGDGKILWTAEMDLDGTGWKATARTDRRVGLTRFTLNDNTNRLHYAFVTDDPGGLLQLWTAEMKNDGSDFKAQQRTYNLRSHNSFNVTLSPESEELFFVYQEFDGRESRYKTAFLPLSD